MPIPLGGGLSDRSHAIDNGVGGAGGTGKSARLNDRRAALLHGADKFAFEPFSIIDGLGGRRAVNLCVGKIRVLRGGVIAPNAEVGNATHWHAGLLRELRLGAVFVQTRHGKEPVVGHVRRVVHGDQAVRVAGVADHQHARIAGGVVIDGLALAGKNLAVNAE